VVREGTSAASSIVAAVVLLRGAACQPRLDIGEWTCAADGSTRAVPAETAPVAVPWSTDFENRFCDYTELAGFCYASEDASYELVTSPVHSGRYAAAFKVGANNAAESQTRCVRQGALPAAAYYGAWYYLPAPALVANNWNLFHFRGGSDLSSTRGVLDVSLVNLNGALRVGVFGVNHRAVGDAADSPPVPIATWFHVQLYVKRAEGTAGELALYQDGQLVFELRNVTTDAASLGQWFVGNLARDLTPSDSTLYVDDISIRATL
jgi:hypothetical protein